MELVANFLNDPRTSVSIVKWSEAAACVMRDRLSDTAAAAAAFSMHKFRRSAAYFDAIPLVRRTG